VDVSYFAVPGPTFRKGSVTESGAFELKTGPSAAHDLTTRINDGQTSCDLNGYERILCVGHRPGFLAVAAALAAHDLLGGTRTGKMGRVSREYLRAMAREQMTGFVDEIKKRYGQSHPFTFTLAPYPSAGIVERIGTYESAQAIADYMKHPDTARIFADWLAIYEELMTGAGYDVMHQPDVTVAGPCTTKQIYATGGVHGDGSRIGWEDHRHMNGDFGYVMLSEFIRTKLNIEPAVSAA
jgi:hypothetical protein